MIEFGIWASDEATFWDSWIAAGIATAPYAIASGYSNSLILSTQSQQGWCPTRATGQMVEGLGGVMVPEIVPVAGWHANVRVSGPLEVEFTYGLAQRDEDGAPVSMWDRTWAKEVFGLTYQESNPETGFPAGYRSAQGVVYCDIADLSSPTNVWA
jgi:hypothetical protein